MKLDLILENIRNRYSLGLLEESEGISEKDLLKGKIMINESTMTIRKMLVEEGTIAHVQGLLQEDWTQALIQENLGEYASNAYNTIAGTISGEDGDNQVNDGMGGTVQAGSITHPAPAPIKYEPTASHVNDRLAGISNNNQVASTQTQHPSVDKIAQSNDAAKMQAGLGSNGEKLGLTNEPGKMLARTSHMVGNTAQANPGMSTGAAAIAGLAGYGSIKAAGSIQDRLRRR